MDHRPAVILLHSSAASARQWDALTALLRPAFDVQAIDLHGHGARPAWPGPAPMALADEAALAADVLRRCVGRVHLVGHSYGAAVAFKLATLQPQRVASVAVYEPVLSGWLRDAGDRAVDDAYAIASTIDIELRAGREHEAARCFVDFWSGAGAWHRLPPAAQASVARRMTSVAAHFGVLFHEPMTPTMVAALALPMLYLSGGRTVRVTQRIAALAHCLLPAARHEEMPGLPHLGPITHADAVAQRIARFVDVQAADARAPEDVAA
jgi:pimeloyl-ACP methyl ester carboxylesterase